jgi:rfaE bifunctional protein nucleotidyltransferase chain/domain
MKSTDIIRTKIFSINSLKPVLATWRFKEEKIVFTNGCFDIIHQGHIDYLAKAKDLGSKLIIAVNSDESVRSLNKGNSRPIQDEKSRSIILASLFFVDAVIIFNESTPLELIKTIKPNVLVKGADYTPDQVIGADFVIKNGGKLELIEYLEGFSTTKIETKIKNA